MPCHAIPYHAMPCDVVTRVALYGVAWCGQELEELYPLTMVIGSCYKSVRYAFTIVILEDM